jgi:hypothetical protein
MPFLARMWERKVVDKSASSKSQLNHSNTFMSETYELNPTPYDDIGLDQQAKNKDGEECAKQLAKLKRETIQSELDDYVANIAMRVEMH